MVQVTEQPVELVQIGQDKVSRRSFLKVLGASSGAALAGCGDSAAQKILPYVKGEADQIPGVAVWYKSTCTECSAGCGIKVRTREGRAVKIEGDTENPINRGGLCALGQSSLQDMYDPDRIRQPLKRGSDGQFVPVSWDEAYGMLLEGMQGQGSKAFISSELNGSLADLVKSFSKELSVEHVTFDPLQPTAVAAASELVYGVYGVPAYKIGSAEVVLNFGADFLETFVSPCEYARDWATTRKGDHPTRLVHVEPRLSLTGANADLWLCANPGTEVRIALLMIKLMLERGRGAGLREDVRARLEALTKDVSATGVAAETGVAADKLIVLSQYLADAKRSLVLAGGTATATQDPLSLYVACNFLNMLLGNVGETVELVQVRQPQSSVKALEALVQKMKKGDVGTVFIHKSNPVFALPASFEVKIGLQRVNLVVSFSSHLDETTQMAHLILPSHTSLESWGDVSVIDGVRSMTQPVMRPVFDTRPLGDMLILIAKAFNKNAVADGAENFLAYLKNNWKKVHAASGDTDQFEQFWLKSVERGGYFSASTAERPKVKISDAALKADFKVADFEPGRSGSAGKQLLLMPYFSVRSFDGRAANRPWLQELPDVISKVVWDAWAEIHPDTATELGVFNGDPLTIRNAYGEINVPAYITPHVHKGIVAVPAGQGHTAYGRYAQGVGQNVMTLLPNMTAKGADALAYLSVTVTIMRGVGTYKMVNTQGSNSQMDRDLAKYSVIGAGTTHAAADHAHAHGHAEPKQMYHQREHPLYKWGMAVDLAACTGCSACVVACYAENNIPVVGKKICGQGREMSWLRIERYYDNPAEELHVSFLPMMCQHCGSAPCEPVCPVYATYHNEEGLNAMVYNRCVGTRYCSNNCSYKVRRFNWFTYETPEPLNWQLNPDVTPRSTGIMEKCTFCVQRIQEGKDRAKDLGRPVLDGEIQPACVQSCPTQALAFGNLNDPESRVSKLAHNPRAYKVLDHHLNTQPAISYLEDKQYKI